MTQDKGLKTQPVPAAPCTSPHHCLLTRGETYCEGQAWKLPQLQKNSKPQAIALEKDFFQDLNQFLFFFPCWTRGVTHARSSPPTSHCPV